MLYYVKASDIEYDFCFLEVSRIEGETPFMDIRISEKRELTFFFYGNQDEISITQDEWSEISRKANIFYQSEIENEESFKT